MEQTKVRELQDVVIRFSGDSGDGMQLTGTLFSDTSALMETASRPSPTTPPKSAPRREPSRASRDSRYTSATTAS